MLSPERLERYLALPDLTDAATVGSHAINIALEKITRALEAHFKIGADIVRRHPLVPVEDNFDRLYYEPDAIARSSRYSHYVGNGRIFRTHTTAGIPDELSRTRGDRLIVCPGLVYRRDVVDKSHVGEPHQSDIWLVRKGRLGRANMLGMIEAVIGSVLPGVEFRTNEVFHPYTVNGLEVEINAGGRWLELLECGQINPWLLDDAELPSNQWSGLAMGIGLDRLVMLLKGIDDIRLLRAADPKIAKQMLTLEPFQPVSNQPATRRDLSICVSDPDLEIIGDRIRGVLGAKADWIEEIECHSSTAYGDVPLQAIERLGMKPEHTNLLLRVVLRSLDGAIAKEEGNRIYDLLYDELHEGSRGYWRT
jgi:phenylalanyl-tRNA synthetase alpha chain